MPPPNGVTTDVQYACRLMDQQVRLLSSSALLGSSSTVLNQVRVLHLYVINFMCDGRTDLYTQS